MAGSPENSEWGKVGSPIEIAMQWVRDRNANAATMLSVAHTLSGPDSLEVTVSRRGTGVLGIRTFDLPEYVNGVPGKVDPVKLYTAIAEFVLSSRTNQTDSKVA